MLWTRTWLTKSQIRQAIEPYANAKSVEAFERMFERDKDELRELGIPVVTGTNETLFDDDTTTTGYKIDREAYQLPVLDFTAAEATVLGIASRTWQQASLAGPAARALTKLRAVGVEPDSESLIGVEPRVRTVEPAFAPLYRAVGHRRSVTFSYRKPGGDTAERHLQPWGLLTWHGRWYVSGHDTDRDAPRVFRLSRITGTVKAVGRSGAYEIPDDFDARRVLSNDPAPTYPARLGLAAGTGQSLRMRACGDHPFDADQIDIDFTDLGSFAAELAGYGPDVVVLSPPELRRAVIERLEAFVAGSEEGAR
nr:WYL domain-containing protein [Spelaeicoccus albus]